MDAMNGLVIFVMYQAANCPYNLSQRLGFSVISHRRV
jgi:hypothetical protein